MGLKDLENAGVTLPRDCWGKRAVRSTVSRPLLLLCAGGAIGGGLLMYFGGGGWMTWFGALMFLATLFGATAIALHAIKVQSHETTGGKDHPTADRE